MPIPVLVKVLYIEAGIEMRKSARLLEDLTSNDDLKTSFMVVPNMLTGLEVVDYNDIDIIFVEGNQQRPFGAEAFLNNLQILGLKIPVIIMLNYDSEVTDEMVSFLGFSGVLRRPYTGAALSGVISACLSYSIQFSTSENCQSFDSQFSGLLSTMPLLPEKEIYNVMKNEAKNPNMSLFSDEYVEDSISSVDSLNRCDEATNHEDDSNISNEFNNRKQSDSCHKKITEEDRKETEKNEGNKKEEEEERDKESEDEKEREIMQNLPDDISELFNIESDAEYEWIHNENTNKKIEKVIEGDRKRLCVEKESERKDARCESFQFDQLDVLYI
mmetsp:Transcript_1287/g.1359  ORF Transcript_1287/g.1359 Transcript_1287/m.1359 type:complete len:329 (-) Transcript_1287:33-1019(-)|eukprot:CAMPEP_0182431298 /NCGR_PEP_ID=MMETSP1167-20130531/48016_1 /TAXON_ID=2988 /ORGANISM="Mallomonas Sp, Strain CCMP3275" /LENGTH=328 /DNA_ID=CAMNT_0024617471 /DNA_START=58 /DNA_END=1044 /DNA_ORIENTATION=+